MRVRDLDEHFGVTREEIYSALQELGVSSHFNSGVEPETLALLESRFREEEAAEPDSQEEIAVAIEGMLADFDSALAGEPSPLPEFSDDEKEFLVEETYELTPQDQLFPVCNDAGAFIENCPLPPGLAEKVAAILGKQTINSYLLNLDRGEFVFVVWQTAQKHTVRIDG